MAGRRAATRHLRPARAHRLWDNGTLGEPLFPPPSGHPLSSSSLKLSPGERIDARYVVQRTLGHGGFSTVYLAEQEATGQQVAVKVLEVDREHEPDRVRRRFDREMRLVGQLHHPHIVRLIDRGTLPDGGLFTVYAYVDGTTLHDYIRGRGPLDPERARQLASHVLDALVAAHDAGVVHRDIKPRNIMVTSTGALHNALLLDFGLAALHREEERVAEDSLSRLGVFMGTPPYAAPEQFKGARPTPAMDLYSWGLVLVEMLSGQRVFTGRTAHVVAAQLSFEPVPMPASVRTGPFGRLLESVLHKDPLRRRSDAREVWRDLQALVLEPGVSPAAMPPRPRRTFRESEESTAPVTHSVPVLVGRSVEQGVLQSRWDQAASGHGRAVWVQGEAGLGKSALVNAFVHRLGTLVQPPLWCACTPETISQPRGPLLEALRAWLQAESGEALSVSGIVGWCQAIGLEESPAELVAALMLDGEPLPLWLRQQTAAGRQRIIDDALLDVVAGLAEDDPFLVLVEDVHWADPTFLRWLSTFAEELAGLSCMLVCTSRVALPETAGVDAALFDRLPLGPLEPADSRRLVDQLVGLGLEPDTVQRIVALADGVPLFVEELARAVVEQGDLTGLLADPGVRSSTLPARVRTVVEARLADAGPAREVLAVASVWGRSSTPARLEQLWDQDAETLELGLEALLERGLIRRKGRRRRVEYVIKHQLIRDAAYQTLAPGRRRQLHKVAADWLSSPVGRAAEGAIQPEVVAHHLAQAGENIQAVKMLVQAAHQATERTAMETAMGHVRAGLSLLELEAPSRDRIEAELDLRAVEAPIWFAKTSYGSRPAERTLVRGLELSRDLGGTSHDFSLRWGLWVCTTAQSRHRDGLVLAEQLLELAQTREDPGLQAEAHLAMGHTMYYLPELQKGVDHLERSIALYDEHEHWDHALRFGQDPMVMSSVFAGVMRDLLGRTDLGTKHIQQAEAAAEHRDHSMSRAMMMCIRTVHHQVLREPEATLSSAERLIAYTQRARMPYWGSIGRVYAAWARSQQGQPATREMQEAVRAFLATGSANNSSAYFTMLAEVQIAERDLESARTSLLEAERRAERFGEHRMLAEALRLKGRYLIENRWDALTCLEQARALAHQQGARLLEVRSLMSSLEIAVDPDTEVALLSAITAVLETLPAAADAPDLEAARRRVGMATRDDTLDLSLDNLPFP